MSTGLSTELTEKLTKSEISFAKNTHLAHRKSYLVIIGPNSHEKLTKSEIMSKVFRSTEIQYMIYYMCVM